MGNACRSDQIPEYIPDLGDKIRVEFLIGLQRLDCGSEKEFLLDGLQEKEPLQAHNF